MTDAASAPAGEISVRTLRITLDTNCLIDLEENRPAAPHIRDIAVAQRSRLIALRVVAISASERLPGTSSQERDFDVFRSRIRKMGLGEVDILKPIAYWDVTFWDWSYWAQPDMIRLEREIHDVLFPRLEFDRVARCKALGIDPDGSTVDPKWRNAKCDVLAFWSHIHHDCDIFVTSDRNFHKATKKPKLLALGARDILTPAETCARISRGPGASAPSLSR